MASSSKTTTRTRKSTSAGRTSTRRSSASKSSTTAKTTKKPSTRAKAAAKPAPKAAPVVTLVTEGSGTASDSTAIVQEVFRRPDLIQAVADRTALKRPDAKAVLELVLDELGKALDGREELVLPPLGKLSVKNRRAASNGAHLTLKLKRPGKSTAKPDQTALAEPGGDS